MRSKIKYFLSTFILILSTSLCQAEVVLKDTQGHDTAFSALKGKWVLINYWAGWCQTCVNEIPEFNRFYQKHKKDSVALFAVNYDSLPLFEQDALTKKLNMGYPSLASNPARELKLGDITGVPMTFIFNPEGKLVKTLYGGQSMASLEKAIAK